GPPRHDAVVGRDAGRHRPRLGGPGRLRLDRGRPARPVPRARPRPRPGLVLVRRAGLRRGEGRPQRLPPAGLGVPAQPHPHREGPDRRCRPTLTLFTHFGTAHPPDGGTLGSWTPRTRPRSASRPPTAWSRRWARSAPPGS